MGMKAEINNENKVKFFALYWGQEVLFDDLYGNKNLIVNSGINLNWVNWSIELKPLSLITDEDAEVINLTSEDYNEDGWVDKDGLFYFWAFQDIDYLRSKGYALHWMGLSVKEMVDAGWIKLTEK
jgi:hypothetical protein